MTYPVDSLLYMEVDTSTAVGGVFAEKMELHVYPNPASHEINVEFPGYDGKGSELVIYDKTGKTWRKEKTNNNGSANFNLNISDLPNGEYFIKGKTGHLVRSGRFVKM